MVPATTSSKVYGDSTTSMKSRGAGNVLKSRDAGGDISKSRGAGNILKSRGADNIVKSRGVDDIAKSSGADNIGTGAGPEGFSRDRSRKSCPVTSDSVCPNLRGVAASCSALHFVKGLPVAVPDDFETGTAASCQLQCPKNCQLQCPLR
jgi:hypothetical protein